LYVFYTRRMYGPRPELRLVRPKKMDELVLRISVDENQKDYRINLTVSLIENNKRRLKPFIHLPHSQIPPKLILAQA